MEPYTKPEQETQFIDGNRYHLPSDGILANNKIVKDTLLNQTAWNIDRFPNSVCTIAGYSDGSPIEVTYFNQDNPQGDFRNNPTDIVLGTDHAIHKNLIKIYNMELRLLGALDYNFDAEANRMTVVGQAYTHMGFKPNNGDFFYMLLQDGKWGIMAIRDVQRLALSQATFHKCDIELVRYLTSEYQNYFEQCVVDERYFDKQKYLTANMTLLSTKSYVQLGDTLQLRKEIISRYNDMFLDNLTHSFIRPDGLYDPYVVEFWHHKVSVIEYPERPQQLLPEVNDYKYTIWSCFTDKTRYNGPQDCERHVKAIRRKNTYFHTGITGLIDKEYIGTGLKTNPKLWMERDLEGTYIFKDNFYNHLTDQMLPNERLVFEVLSNIVDIDTIITWVKNYRSWDKEFAFYWIPISLWLLDRAYMEITD